MKFRNCLLLLFLFTALSCFGDQEDNRYSEENLSSLRVPVGGVGTGNLLLGGRGNIEFVEVFNQPDRQRRLEKTFFALWVQQGNNAPAAKLLERELFPPYTESTHKYVYGLPRMGRAEFFNNFPLHDWHLMDADIPLDVSMQAFSPFIPLDVEKSSYPIVVFYWNFRNTASEPINASIVMNMENPIRDEHISNIYVDSLGVQGVRFIAQEANDINYQGDLFVGTTAADIEAQTHWYPGEWRDEAHTFWDDFSDDGFIEQKLSDWHTTYKPTSYNETTKRMSSVLVRFELQPGQNIRIPFYVSWYFPDRSFGLAETFGIEPAANKPFRNFYSPFFTNALDVLQRFRKQEPWLYEQIRKFSELLSSSSYPASVKEALTTQAASLRSPLIQVTENGHAHGFEGVFSNGWCCPGTCTHVWNYTQTLASLFPSLERSMREIEFVHNTFDNGFQTHRAVFPLGDYWFDGPAAADGQMGTIVRAYREWKLSGDNEWLAKLWPKIQKALEFAWSGPGTVNDLRFKHQESQAAWDPDKTGILSNRQHNTYDINFYGPNSMTTSLYLAALKACSEMAKTLGDEQKSKEYLNVYNRGRQTAQDSLWNGEYFVQIVKEHLQDDKNADFGQTPKYQYGDGCLSDQLLGQYIAFNADLGYILDSTKVQKALKAVYDHNFIKPMRSFANVQRVFALNDEGGVVLCTWPHNNRPALPFVYADEVWTGVEYQVAASLIYAGFVEEGLDIVEAVNNRYDGHKRNPFEHDESGVHYARALASWSLVLALSGVEYDATTHTLMFDPKISRGNFRTFWSTGSAWGGLTIDGDVAVLSVEYGELSLERFGIKGMISKSYAPSKRLTAGDQLVLKAED